MHTWRREVESIVEAGSPVRRLLRDDMVTWTRVGAEALGSVLGFPLSDIKDSLCSALSQNIPGCELKIPNK